MSQNEFILYPLDTGEDPVCLSCSTIMVLETVEAPDHKPGFIVFRCEQCGSTEKFICEEP
jgi:hypothetical protein